MIANRLLTDAMTLLGQQPNSMFVGQNVRYEGTPMFRHLVNVPMEQRIEFPVAEDLQMGFCTGLALQGFFPIAIYPRFDFLLLAFNQLVNHLDKLEQMSRGQFTPKVIVRTAVGKRSPLDAGPQHTQNHTEAFWRMLTNTEVYEIKRVDKIKGTYDAAIHSKKSVVVVENF